MTSEPAFSPCLRLHVDDNILVARTDVAAGMSISGGQDGDSPVGFTTLERIGLGHKVASRPIAVGEPIRKYGQVIGYSTGSISAGEWVHTHNVEPGDLELDYAFSSAVPQSADPITDRTFQGYRRADGRAATRNYLGVVSTVNCSATTSKYVARAFNEGLLEDFPNIDGVVVVTTPQEVSLLDSRKSINFAETVKVPVLGIIENMSGYTLNGTAEPNSKVSVMGPNGVPIEVESDDEGAWSVTLDLFKRGGGEEAAEELGVPFLGRLPFDPGIVRGGDDGVHRIIADPDGEAAQAFDGIVNKLIEGLSTSTGSSLNII